MSDYPLETVVLPMGAKEIKDATKMEPLWNDDKYIAEEKYDGSRYLSIGGRFFSRRISDVTGSPVEKTANVPHLNVFLEQYPNLILDGEVYYDGLSSNEVTSIMGASPEKAQWRQGFGLTYLPDDKGKGKWRISKEVDWNEATEIPEKEVAELKERLAAGTVVPLKYVLFDILRDIDGTWLIDEPWIVRRAKLLRVYADMCMDMGWTEINNIELSRVEKDDKRGFCDEIMAKGGEGVILKNIHGKYVPDKKPSWNWVKVKKHITVDVVIMGFKPAVKVYEPERPELIDTWQYWVDCESEDFVRLNGKGEAEKYADAHGLPYTSIVPVTKFYFNDWIGAVTFGQWGKFYTDSNGIEYTEAEINARYNSGIAEGYDIPYKDYLETFGESIRLVELGYFSGINEELRADMSANPSKYIGECVEIGAMEQTKDGFYRHPQFSRLRPDKNPSECVIGG